MGTALHTILADELDIAPEEVAQHLSFYVDLTARDENGEAKQTLAFVRVKHVMHYMVIAAGNLMQLANIEVSHGERNMREAINRACEACKDFMYHNADGMESHPIKG